MHTYLKFAFASVTSHLSSAIGRDAEVRQELVAVRQSFAALESRSRSELAEKVGPYTVYIIQLNLVIYQGCVSLFKWGFK